MVVLAPHPTNPPNLVRFNPLRCTVDPVPAITLAIVEFMAAVVVEAVEVVVEVDPPRGPRLLDIPPLATLPLDTPPPPAVDTLFATVPLLSNPNRFIPRLYHPPVGLFSYPPFPSGVIAPFVAGSSPGTGTGAGPGPGVRSSPSLWSYLSSSYMADSVSGEGGMKKWVVRRVNTLF